MKRQVDTRLALDAAIDARWKRILAGLDYWIERKDKDVLLGLLALKLGRRLTLDPTPLLIRLLNK